MPCKLVPFNLAESDILTFQPLNVSLEDAYYSSVALDTAVVAPYIKFGFINAKIAASRYD